jgi:exosortase/archaeosortase family protein
MIVLGAVAGAAWPVWPWYVARLRDGSDQPWCLLALASLALVLMTGSLQPARNFTPALTAPSILMIMYAVMVLLAPPIVRAAAAFLAIGHLLCSWRLGPGLHWGCYALLLLATPAFASLEFTVSFPLRLLAAKSASWLLAAAGYVVTPEGTLLRWCDRLVEVDLRCSGIRMLYGGSWMAATLAAVYGFNFRLTILTLMVGLAAVVSGNILRTTALFFPEAGVISLPPWSHSAVGLALFALMTSSLCWATWRIRRQWT